MPNDEFQKVIEELTTNQHRLMGSNFRPRDSGPVYRLAGGHQAAHKVG